MTVSCILYTLYCILYPVSYILYFVSCIVYVLRHTDLVTCIGMDEGGNHCISGSQDTTAIIWELNPTQDTCTPRSIQVWILFKQPGGNYQTFLSDEIKFSQIKVLKTLH